MTREDFERDAWRAYLRTCRAASAQRYEEVEPWAWSRLQQRLRLIEHASERSTREKALA